MKRWIELVVFSLGLAVALGAQSVPKALESPPAGPPHKGPNGETLEGMPKFHDPAPYDIDEHTGYKQIFDGKSFDGWDADPTIWRVEDGLWWAKRWRASRRAGSGIRRTRCKASSRIAAR